MREISKFVKTIIFVFVLGYLAFFFLKWLFPSYIDINDDVFIMTSVFALVCAILNIGI